MAIAWFTVPYVPAIITAGERPGRELLLLQQHDLRAQWSEVEILGNRAIVKMEAAPTVLLAVAALPGVYRFPFRYLKEPVSSEPLAVRLLLRQEMLDQGYTNEQINGRFGRGFEGATFRDVLLFMCSLWKRPFLDNGVISFGEAVDGSNRRHKRRHPIDYLNRVVR